MNFRYSHRRLFRRIHVLPSLLTLGNFSCGFFSIVLCLNALYFATRAQTMESRGEGTSMMTAGAIPIMPLDENGKSKQTLSRDSVAGSNARAAYMFHWACVIIFLGMLFDMLDGKVARHMGADSAFGKELDSLADVTTFGVAPPVIVNTLWIAVMPATSSWWGQVLIFGVVFAVCAVLRLARYNIQSGTADKNIFSGLPSPAAAGCVVTAVLVAQGNYVFIERVCGWLSDFIGPKMDAVQVKANLLALFLLIPGLLMVTTVPFVHLANRYLAGKKSFTILVMAVLLLALVWQEPRMTLFVLFNGYMLIGIVAAVRRKWRSGGAKAAAAWDGGDTEEGGS